MPHDASRPIVRQPVQLDGEVWKSIPNTEERYEASTLGRVRSMVAANHHGTFRRERPLVCTPYASNRYLLFNLRMNGRYCCRQLGSLILDAHVGPAPTLEHEAAHLDGNPHNNRIENLVWATPKENAHHKRLHGTQHLRPKLVRDGVELYRCTCCDSWLPRAGFYRSKTPCGITSWCRRCSNQARRELRRRRRPPIINTPPENTD